MRHTVTNECFTSDCSAVSLTGDCCKPRSPIAQPLPMVRPLGCQSWSIRPNNTPLASLYAFKALWSSPWEPCPSSLVELSPQHAGIQRKWLHNRGDSITLLPCLESLTLDPLTTKSSFFLSQQPLKYLSPQLITPWSIIHLPLACNELLTCSW